MSTNFDPELIHMIRCPITKSSLAPASPSLIEDMNRRIADGTLVNRMGQAVTDKLDGGFVNSDESWLLPVRGGIVVLIADQAIQLK
jgi:uncharacterized protein YbaR (Trm112 family)